MNMKPFTCFIIGESSLPIKCAEKLLFYNHTIKGIISKDTEVLDWARDNNIPLFHHKKKEMFSYLRDQSFDYFFSINSNYIIPDHILALPKRFAINYHDSPLPGYAGKHATSWAIMNRETKHAISWHVVESKIDTGDLLKQVHFNIEPGETAFTLNLKCYENAINAFEELILELADMRETRTKQNLIERSYFGMYKRPDSACIFSFHEDAYAIESFLRSLNFAAYENPLGMPKILVDNECYVIKQVSILDPDSDVPSGTVVAVNNHTFTTLTISTTTKDIEITEIFSIDGERMDITAFVERHGLRKGCRFSKPEPGIFRKADHIDSLIAHHEKFWVKRIGQLQSLDFFTCEGPSSDNHLFSEIVIPLILDISEWGESGELGDRPFCLVDILIMVFSIYLSKISGNLEFDMGYSDPSIRDKLKGLPPIFAHPLPLHVELNPRMTFKELLTVQAKERQRIRKRKTFARDILMRYPSLEKKRVVLEKSLSIGVTVVGKIGDFKPGQGILFNLIVPQSGNECLLITRTDIPGKESIVKHFSEIVTCVIKNRDILLQDIYISHEFANSESFLDDENLEDFGF